MQKSLLPYVKISTTSKVYKLLKILWENPFKYRIPLSECKLFEVHGAAMVKVIISWNVPNIGVL